MLIGFAEACSWMLSPSISKLLLNSDAFIIQSQGAVYNIKSM